MKCGWVSAVVGRVPTMLGTGKDNLFSSLRQEACPTDPNFKSLRALRLCGELVCRPILTVEAQARRVHAEKTSN